MTFKTLETWVPREIADGESFTVGYPTGTAQADFAGDNAASDGKAIVDNNEVYLEADSDVAFAYGLTTITVTNTSGVTWPKNAELVLEFGISDVPASASSTAVTALDGRVTVLESDVSAIEAAATSTTGAAAYRDDAAAVLADDTLAYTGGGAVSAGDTIRTRSEGFAYEVAASDATDEHVTTAGGVKLYFIRDGRAVPIEAFGGAADNGTTNNSVALQAIIDALGADGVDVVFAAPSDVSGNSLTGALQRYEFSTKVTQPITSRVRLIGKNKPTIWWDANSSGELFYELQAGSSDKGGFEADGLTFVVRNDGRCIGTVATGFQRMRTFAIRHCTFASGDLPYVDMVTDYTYNPAFEHNVFLGGGVRWRGDTGVNFTASSPIWNHNQISNGAGANSTIRQCAFWVEGWGGLSGSGNIWEGNARKALPADGGFENTSDGVSVSMIYLRNCAGFRKVVLEGHFEIVGTDAVADEDHDDGTDFDLYIRNDATSNRGNFNIELGGGLEQIETGRIKLVNNTANDFGVVTFAGGQLREDFGSLDITGPCEVVYKDALVVDDFNPLVASPFVRVDGYLYETPTTGGETQRFAHPSLQLYDYKGGWPSNPEFEIAETYSTTNGSDVERYVQCDPVYGATLLINTGDGGGAFDIALSKPPLSGREWVNMHMTARLVRSAGLSTAVWQGYFRLLGSDDQVNDALQTKPEDMTPLAWCDFQTQAILPANALTDGTQFRLPSLRSVSAWLQVSAWSVSLGKGYHVGRGGQSSERFVCNEDIYFNPGNGFTPADGTVVEGCEVISRGYSSDYIERWVCTGQGTSRTISTTADTTSGSASITLADSTVLVPGDFITIAGVSGTKRVLDVDYSADTATIDSNADATVSAGAVANDVPTWEARWNGKVQVASGTPVGSVTPVAIGQVYQDSGASNKAYMATGLTNSDWAALN